nr:hypothetical protein [Marinicella sp. W31]MDC2879571.1 hypothetical protein [Marinicella sp. W31]
MTAHNAHGQPLCLHARAIIISTPAPQTRALIAELPEPLDDALSRCATAHSFPWH